MSWSPLQLTLNLIAIYSLSSAVYVTYRLASRVLTRVGRIVSRNAANEAGGYSSGYRTTDDNRVVRLMREDAEPGADEHSDDQERV